MNVERDREWAGRRVKCTMRFLHNQKFCVAWRLGLVVAHLFCTQHSSGNEYSLATSLVSDVDVLYTWAHPEYVLLLEVLGVLRATCSRSELSGV